MSELDYDPDKHDPPAVFDVHKVALQEIDRVVGNEATLGEADTARLRGILSAALSEQTGTGNG